jgi:mannitol 2-dehydrogenase
MGDRGCVLRRRPDWDRVGATFTDDVHDYEAMKIRILNAGHQVLANAGELLSVPTIADCMAHPRSPHCSARWRSRKSCRMSPVPGMTPGDYVG